jgi:hypothetical protein
MPAFATTRRPAAVTAGLTALTALLLTVFGSRPAAAQVMPGETSPGEIAVAASFNFPRDVNREPDCIDLNLPCRASGRTVPDAGWAFLASRNLTDRFAITGEVGLYHNLWDSEASVHTLHREDNVVHFLMAGPRVETPFRQQRGRTPSEARLFGQLLAGVAGGDVVIGGFAIQPGIGGDIRFQNGVIVRLQLDYSFVPGPGRSISGARLLLAVGVGVGSRLW